MPFMNKPEMGIPQFTFTDEAQSGYNVAIGLTNIAKALMYAADRIAKSYEDAQGRSGTE